MVKYTGKNVCSGVAIGPAVIFNENSLRIKKVKTSDIEHEIDRAKISIATTKQQLEELFIKIKNELGEESARIFKAHQMILEDPEYVELIFDCIREEKVNAEYAVAFAGQFIFHKIQTAPDDYIKSRAVDMKDVSDRLLRNLSDAVEEELDIKKPSIVVADHLTPSQAIRLEKEKVLALVTNYGTMNSHVAIIARLRNIPMVMNVGLPLEQFENGQQCAVDAQEGYVIFDPSEEVIEKIRQKILLERKRVSDLQEIKFKKDITKGGQKIDVYANISSLDDIDEVLENNARGIGLFRSEFLYFERDHFPTEEEQVMTYKKVLQRMGEKRVVIRTLDIGADKQLVYFPMDPEKNPSLGCRGIRVGLKNKEILKNQLRALFRAAVYGNLEILYPMITSCEEVLQIQEMIEEIRQELEEAKIAYKIPRQGILVETPAAVMISDELAKMVDFFSIGTNDLTQYALAIDRGNEEMEGFYNPYHLAIFRMVEMAVKHAHGQNIEVGICGELGAELDIIEEFAKLEIDYLSVAPAAVLPAREKIRSLG